MTTGRRDPQPHPTPAEDARFARWLGELYRAPAMTEAGRRRFDLLLEARLAGSGRARPWLTALAAATATAFAFAVWIARAPLLGRSDSEAAVAAESAEAVLALATEPVADADDALPVEYRAISYMFIDADPDTEGAPR
jgi:hypothetical protein